jgi:hypothetical protein
MGDARQSRSTIVLFKLMSMRSSSQRGRTFFKTGKGKLGLRGSTKHGLLCSTVYIEMTFFQDGILSPSNYIRFNSIEQRSRHFRQANLLQTLPERVSSSEFFPRPPPLIEQAEQVKLSLRCLDTSHDCPTHRSPPTPMLASALPRRRWWFVQCL